MSERLLDNNCNVQNVYYAICIGGPDSCAAYCNNNYDQMYNHLKGYLDTTSNVINWNY